MLCTKMAKERKESSSKELLFTFLLWISDPVLFHLYLSKEVKSVLELLLEYFSMYFFLNTECHLWRTLTTRSPLFHLSHVILDNSISFYCFVGLQDDKLTILHNYFRTDEYLDIYGNSLKRKKVFHFHNVLRLQGWSQSLASLA